MNPAKAAFTCTHSPALPELLTSLNCSLAISTYQAGRVILISAKDGHGLIQFPRAFAKPMGIAVDKTRLAVATHTEVVVFNNAPRMAPHYPRRPGVYDALYLPRATYFTGEVDIHDLHWCGEQLLAVNTRFSCLARIDHRYSFTPVWKPFFISNLGPDDRCHLNGVAFERDQPRFVTALGMTDVYEGWRANRATGGIVVEVETNSLIAEGLSMPHSPRLYDDKLWLLESGKGRLLRIEPGSGKKEVVVELDGFPRGMDRLGDLAFIGLSKTRKTSTFQDLPISKKSISSGVVVVHLPSGRIVGKLEYQDSVDEIYDVRVLAHMRRPTIVSHLTEDHRMALTTPTRDYWALVDNQEKHEQPE